MKRKYMVNPDCIIEESRKILTAQYLEKCSYPYVLLHLQRLDILLMSKEMRKVLMGFKTPSPLSENNLSKGLSDHLNFLIQESFLIEINDYCSFKDPEIPTFPGYKKIDTLKSNEKIAIYKVKNRKNNLFIIKHLNNKCNNSLLSYFKQEIDIYKTLGDHELICKLISYNLKKNYFILEYAMGDSLDLIIKAGRLDLKQKLRIIENILRVMAFIHSKGVIHGDIHAKQFIVDRQMGVKIIDFDFSFNLNLTPDQQKVRHGGMLQYIEPENMKPNIINRFKQYLPTMKAEVYRIGVLLYYLIYEKHPVRTGTWGERNEDINKEIEYFNLLPNKEKVPDGLVALIKRCLVPSQNRVDSAETLYSYFKQEFRQNS